MKKPEYLKNYWRKLDNVAKLFSLDSSKNTNIFRYSVVLRKKVNVNILKQALMKALDQCKSFKVRIGTGLFWNYLEFNTKEPTVEKESDIPCQNINFKKNNGYLFKITYYKNKINLDIIHSLTDGTGAIKFLKSIIYSYLNIKHKLPTQEVINYDIIYRDQYLNHYDKKIKSENKFKLAYQIPGKVNRNVNNTYHYIIDIEKIKTVCKNYNVTITEYLTAMYVFAMYTSLYKKTTKKEIAINLPIDLRKYYQVDTLSNFFVCAKIEPKMKENKLTTFEQVLTAIHQEFKNKINLDKVKSYLTRDVNLGNNIGVRMVPLTIKKIAMKYILNIANQETTSTISNVGIIDIDKEYKKYIDNILILTKPSKREKIKCTICSYDKKLNVTMNSNIDDTNFEHTFLKLLQSQINNIKLETNLIK